MYKSSSGTPAPRASDYEFNEFHGALTIHLQGDFRPGGLRHVGVGGQAGEGRVDVLALHRPHHQRRRHHLKVSTS